MRINWIEMVVAGCDRHDRGCLRALDRARHSSVPERDYDGRAAVNVWMTVLVALVTGLGVYRSCTRFREIMPVALTIDAAMVALFIFVACLIGGQCQ